MPLLMTALILAQAAAPMPMAKTPEPVCVRAGDLPPAFAKWNAAPGKTLVVGTPVVLKASPTVAWAVPPKKPGAGAVATFSVATAGTYQIGLSNGTWIDVVRGGKSVASTAHGHGPLCTGLRKIVSFALTPCRYSLQLASMPAAETRVMVVPG